MSKLGVAGAAMGVGGTGAAGTYTAYSLGAFGGGSDLSGDGFANPLHQKIIGDGRQYQPLTIPSDESTPTSNSNI